MSLYETHTAIARVLYAAMEAREERRCHAFVDYSPHVNWVTVEVHPFDQRYVEGLQFTVLYSKHIALQIEDVAIDELREAASFIEHYRPGGGV